LARLPAAGGEVIREVKRGSKKRVGHRLIVPGGIDPEAPQYRLSQPESNAL